MKKIQKALLVVLSLLSFGASEMLAQGNIFHNREFWAKKPGVEEVKQKMAEGHNILEMGPGGWDGPLLAIMADGQFETIQFILDQPGIDVNVVTHHSNNYLMWTTARGNLPVMELLMKKGSKTDIINSHGQSLLMHAPMSGKADPAIYDFCLKNGGDIKNDKDEEGRNVMLAAIANLKDISFLNYFVSKGLSLKDTDKKGNGLFHYAVGGGNVKTLQDLVTMGVSYAPNTAGENAFTFVGKGRAKVTVELLQYLKSLGLDPKGKAANGQTLAHTAARLGLDEQILKFITESGVNLTQADQDGNTPLMLAATRGELTNVTYWLASNNVKAINAKGASALTNAVAFNKPEVVKLLIDKGADTRILDKEGHDLYYHLVFNHRKGSIQRTNEIIELLKASGADIRRSANQGVLLHTALEKDDTALLGKLFELGLNVNAKDKDGYTILHYASMKAKNLDLLQFLVQKGADPGITTELDETVLDLIAENEVLGKQKLNLDFLKK
ncbi:ankyrin repeat domain-containing protein [Haliscomenobacter sp.]|uniref:ankyrin repeat domain-containing protein n=1 Tax=Haliscomenobacter sp. TaxID=2717303 RepID=UPI00359453AF